MSLLEISKEQLVNKTIYTYGDGCESCLQQGYSGRVPIHELLVMNDDIRNLLMKTQDSTAIRKLAVESGMKTLRQSAVNKVLQGITSIERLLQRRSLKS